MPGTRRLEARATLDPAAFQCGERSPPIEATIDHLSRVAVTGAQLATVASYLERHGQPDTALRFAEEAVRRAPLCWTCEDTRSLLLLQKGDPHGARAANARALALLPERSKDQRPQRRRAMLDAVGAPRPPNAAPPEGSPPPPAEGTTGHLPQAAVQTVFRGNGDALRCCYELTRAEDRRAEDRVVLTLRIRPDGSTGDATLASSTLTRPDTERCLVRQAQKMRFPPPEGGTTLLRYGLQLGERASR